MGPSRYDHLIFISNSPYPASCMSSGCDDLKRPSGERNPRKTSSRFFPLRTSELLEPVSVLQFSFFARHAIARASRQESFRVISTARLRTLPPVHLPPIDVVVCNDPKWRSYLEVGFVLRCFQHLSVPDAATRPCPWRDNRLAGGRSNTVLSY